MSRTQRKYSSTGCYHIMLRGNEKKDIFLDDHDRFRFLDLISKKIIDKELVVYAYCLMNNHVHLVVHDENDQISGTMKGVATGYAMFFNIKYDRVGHVFQDRFRSEAVLDDRYLLAVTRYVHNNPVKAGLVDQPDQYRWSSYKDYLSPEGSEITDPSFVLGLFADNREKAVLYFMEFSRKSDDTEYIDDHRDRMHTLEEGRTFLENYINGKWPGRESASILSDKILLREVIRMLGSSTSLSQRKIAALLEVDRGVVERIMAK